MRLFDKFGGCLSVGVVKNISYYIHVIITVDSGLLLKKSPAGCHLEEIERCKADARLELWHQLGWAATSMNS